MDDKKLKSAIREIAQLTQINDANGALIEVAKLVDDKETHEEMERMERDCARIGYTPQEFIARRMKIMYKLLATVHFKFGDEARRIVHKSL